jgi:uncharacterized protein
MTTQLLSETKKYVQSEMSNNDSSHDWNHILRVHRLTQFLAKNEKLDETEYLIAELSAILHDIRDWKYSGNENECINAIQIFLKKQAVDQQIIENICFVVSRIGFSQELSSVNSSENPSLNRVLAIVQDADRLDALGAIGIARCLIYGGAKGHILYDPELKPRERMTTDEYKYGRSTTLNHFPEKLFKLKDLMKTQTGFQIAQSRVCLMEKFYHQFQREWNGHDFF